VAGNVSEELVRLAALRDQGILTADEFETQKAAVLRGGHYVATEAEAPAVAKKRYGKGCLVLVGIIVVLMIIGAIVGPGERTAPSSNTVAEDKASSEITVAADAPEGSNTVMAATAEPESAPSVGLFGPQANAARSAQQYLDMTGFSRRGLIEQLSSDAGNGYSAADATAAVDSLAVDWDEQAVRSAKQYLEMTGFSCSGLVEQLSSDAGSKYTKAQARFGAEKAGAC
jgi:hypothetical protein